MTIISRGYINIFTLWLQEPQQEIKQISSHVCSELLSSCNKQTRIIFLTNIQQTKALLRKITRLRKKIVILMKTKVWGDVTECFLPSSHKWLEFTYVNYLRLVLHRGSFARCDVNGTQITSMETETSTSCCWGDLGKYPEVIKRNK